MTLRVDNLTILQGTTWGARWPLQDKAGAAVNLTGWSARAQAREFHGSPVVKHSWSVAENNVTLDAQGLLLEVTAAQSSEWTWTNAVYDVELFHLDGTVIRITQGSIKVSPEVTR